MSGINLNKSEDYVKELKIFNDGKAGIVENVRVRIERKASTDSDDKKPVYKLIATDGIGEVNEGFYYQEPNSDGFNKYQAQRLILLAKGVLGEDIKFPEFNTPKEALDWVMLNVAPVLDKSFYRVAVCYGTTKRKSQYLGFKSFGNFIEPVSKTCSLALSASDSLVKGEAKPVDAQTLVKSMNIPSGTNLSWMDKT